jgi:hypothetical protein
MSGRIHALHGGTRRERRTQRKEVRTLLGLAGGSACPTKAVRVAGRFPERRGGAEQNRPAFRQSGERRIHNGMIRVIAPSDSEQNIAIDQMARRRHYA